MHVWTQKGQYEETSVRPGGKEGAVERRAPSRLRCVLEGSLLAWEDPKERWGWAVAGDGVSAPSPPPHAENFGSAVSAVAEARLWLEAGDRLEDTFVLFILVPGICAAQGHRLRKSNQSGTLGCSLLVPRSHLYPRGLLCTAGGHCGPQARRFLLTAGRLVAQGTTDTRHPLGKGLASA